MKLKLNARKIRNVLLALFILPYFLVLIYAVVPPISIPVISSFITFNNVKWSWVSADSITDNFYRAAISAEDQKFCIHNGVDWKSLSTVINRVSKAGDYSYGGSTINMQITKNLFLWPLPKVIRKPLEIPLALWADLVWSKKRSLQIYANIAQFGDGIYGVEAASKAFFMKPASALTTQEASLLAAILPNPEGRNPAKPKPYVSYYAAKIRGQMYKIDASCLKAR